MYSSRVCSLLRLNEGAACFNRSTAGVLTVAGGRCRIFYVTTQIFLKSTWNYNWPIEGYSCPYFVSDQPHITLYAKLLLFSEISKSRARFLCPSKIRELCCLLRSRCRNDVTPSLNVAFYKGRIELPNILSACKMPRLNQLNATYFNSMRQSNI